MDTTLTGCKTIRQSSLFIRKNKKSFGIFYFFQNFVDEECLLFGRMSFFTK
jgi:hypothetical protein